MNLVELRNRCMFWAGGLGEDGLWVGHSPEPTITSGQRLRFTWQEYCVQSSRRPIRAGQYHPSITLSGHVFPQSENDGPGSRDMRGAP